MTTCHDDDAAAPSARLSVDTPLGRLLLVGDESALAQVRLPGTTELGSTPGAVPTPLRAAASQLEEYFSSKRTSFRLPLELRGTPFQLSVWRALAGIPFGETITYGDLACRVGRPRACRAVGQANGANPLPIIYPCHRVVAAGRHLGGYGGGLEMKRRLLELEGALAGWD
ncbi:MAG: methylated-DNA--[protein]-cysteine S-methyltransferase [Actinomycetota bacterium]|jgi:methylated-DNA-[protein]-cysteine S-methyltransferase|nr:methylated-DNA--[protein]-cysteine S-methyltransferase [Actinomycetota bacterium]